MQTDGLKRVFYKGLFAFKKHSPEIFVIGGVVGIVVSTVLACRATLKVGDILDEHKSKIDDVHAAYDNLSEEPNVDENYISENERKDITKVYTQTALKVISLYAPAAALGALSITGILTSHHILQKRNVALAAAYATLDRGFKSYRERVIDKYGEDVDREMEYGITKQKIEEEVIDEETGKKKKVKREANVVDMSKLSDSPHSRLFGQYTLDECNDWVPNINWVAGGIEYNRPFLKSMQSYFNDLLIIKGRIFLNDVYKELGFSPTKSGQIVGWEYRPDDPNFKGDNYIDFGMYDVDIPIKLNDEMSYEKAILLEFNIDGNVWSNMSMNEK